VQHASVVNELDRSGADHAQVLDGLGALREDRRAGAMELDLRGRRNALERRALERVERWMLTQEAGDLRRRRRDLVQTAAGGAACSTGRRASCLIISAHFSPTIIVVMHGLMAGRNGRIEPSATR